MITTNLLYTILLFILYGMFDIAVPAVVLYPFVKKYEFGFRILFYQAAYLAYLNFTSFALAFVGIYTCFMSWFTFVILPLSIRIYIDRKKVNVTLRNTYNQIKREIQLKEGFRKVFRRRKMIMDDIAMRIWKGYIKKYYIHILILGLLIYLVGNGLGYFHLHSYTYACSDEPTHIYWISNLINGNPFPAGLYPHGEHFIVAQFCSMFGLNVARSWMSFGIVANTIIMFSAFLLARKVFSSNVAALLGVAIFLISGLFSTAGWFQRFVMVIPMEFAMYAFFVMIYGLITWIQDQKKISLVMVGLGILGTTIIHFFVTIFAFFTVVAFILIYHRRMRKNKTLHELIICGVLAITLTVVPYVTGIICGFQLEQSFAWGMSNVSVGGGSYTVEWLTDVGYREISDPVSMTLKEQFLACESFEEYYDLTESIMTMYFTSTGTYGIILLGVTALMFVYGLALLLLKNEDEDIRYKATVYLFISGAWFLEFFALYIGYLFDLFSLVIPTRSTEFISLLSIMVWGVVISIFLDLMSLIKLPIKILDNILSIAAIAGILVFSISGYGITYKDMNYTFTMENEDLKTEEYLMHNAKPETWTFISTTNARMGIHNKGYHYEITDLLRCVRDTEELYIPTPDIYIMVEKNVPYMGGKAVNGSDALANSVPVSAGYADVLLSDVMPIIGGSVNSEVYLGNYSREVIMSHLYYWMEKMKEVYPNEVSVFSEDEYCTIYHVKQDEYFLLNLVIDYSDIIARDLALEAENEAIEG